MPDLARAARVPPTSNLNATSSGMPFGVSGTSQLARATPGAASHAETAKESAPAALSHVLAAAARLLVISYPPTSPMASSSRTSIRRGVFSTTHLGFGVDLGRIVETVRPFEFYGLEVESGDGALDRLGLVEKRGNDALDYGVAGIV